MFPQVLEALRIVHWGASSNLWGLGCPFYCTEFSFGSILAAALTGIILGFGLGAWSAFALVGWSSGGAGAEARAREPYPEVPLGGGRLRLRGYLHGRQGA